MFPNGGHGHQPAPAPAPGPGQLPLGQGLGPNVGHHLGHTISPMGPPSSGNQLPGGEGELDVISYFIEYSSSIALLSGLLGALGQGLGFGVGVGLGTMIQPTLTPDHSNSNPTGSSSYSSVLRSEAETFDNVNK